MAITLPVVAAALVRADGHVLLQRRRAGRHGAGLWEFPGGKVEPGETPEAALIRELSEELAIRVDPAALVPATFATGPLGDRHLLLLVYLVRCWSGDPVPHEADALDWVRPGAMATRPMPPADYPVAAMLARVLGDAAPA